MSGRKCGQRAPIQESRQRRHDPAGAALAGLILVYLGAVANEYASFPKTDQSAVRSVFARRAWFAAVGIVFSIWPAIGPRRKGRIRDNPDRVRGGIGPRARGP